MVYTYYVNGKTNSLNVVATTQVKTSTGTFYVLSEESKAGAIRCFIPVFDAFFSVSTWEEITESTKHGLRQMFNLNEI